MSTSFKERLTADLDKAKATGSLRSERIREIVQTAVAEAVSELQAGSSEIRSIVKEAITATLQNLREKGQESKAEVTASIEGVIDGISHARPAAIAPTESDLDAEIDSALLEIETVSQDSSPSVKSWLDAVMAAIRERKEFDALSRQYIRLKAQLVEVDAQLAARYGDRYAEIKTQLENYLQETKTWYDQTKAKVEAGAVDPVQAQQSKAEQKLSEAGATAARKEAELKQYLKDLWQRAVKR
jgi:hypothetical protein